MSEIRKAHEEEQAEAREEQAQARFREIERDYFARTKKLDQEHEEWKKRLERSRKLFEAVLLSCIVLVTLLFVAVVVKLLFFK